MSAITEPTIEQLEQLVAPYLQAQPEGLGFAIGYASPAFPGAGKLFFAGKMIRNQLNRHIELDADTPFEIASISKTFTALLYALLVRKDSSTLTLGDVTYPCGPLKFSDKLANIPLDALMNYTSGLPQDNSGGPLTFPKYLPTPYSETALVSYMGDPRFEVGNTGGAYTYSNLGFAIMAAVLNSLERYRDSSGASFSDLVRSVIFEPLGLGATFFDGVSLARLPLGYQYDYGQNPPYSVVPSAGWPYFPAYFGAGGVVASPKEMLTWLRFNMGMIQSPLASALPALQTPSTPVTWGDNHLGLGWFLNPASPGTSASVWKDGELSGTQTYIALLPSPQPGVIPSEAGVFVLTNASGIANAQGQDTAAVLANDLLLIMQGQTPPMDKSGYPTLRGRSAEIRRV